MGNFGRGFPAPVFWVFFLAFYTCVYMRGKMVNNLSCLPISKMRGKVGVEVIKKLQMFNCDYSYLLIILAPPSYQNPYPWNHESYDFGKGLPAHSKDAFSYNLVSIALKRLILKCFTNNPSLQSLALYPGGRSSTPRIMKFTI
jgi:hypothetical protein